MKIKTATLCGLIGAIINVMSFAHEVSDTL